MDSLPGWALRALKHPELHTKDNKSVYTKSVGVNGKEYLFPLVRFHGAGLEEMDVDTAFAEAMQKGDYLVFDSVEEANAWAGAFSEQLGRLGSRTQLQEAMQVVPILTLQLDPETYQPVKSGGRFFNVPIRHPVTELPFAGTQAALEFALQRGYLGRGFETANEARFESEFRNSEQAPPSTISGMVRRMNPDEADRMLGYRTPYNPGGRAPDGFQYPAWDMNYVSRRENLTLEQKIEFDNVIANRFDVELPEGKPRNFITDDAEEAEIERSKTLFFSQEALERADYDDMILGNPR